MTINRHRFTALFVASFTALILLSSCSNSNYDIPFPESELGNSQPVSEPLVFTAEKKIIWDTSDRRGIKPVVKKLDIDAIPAIPYDTSGFKPFKTPPRTLKFDFNSLPEQPLDIEKLQAFPFQFKTSLLPQTVNIKAPVPSEIKSKTIAIYEFGNIRGIQSNFITCVLKDKAGLLWIAANEGIFRYDGSNVQLIRPHDKNNVVLGMVEDNKGRIWHINETGIGFIDIKNNTTSYSEKISATRNRLYNMFKDKSGLIWVCNREAKALSIIDPEKNTFRNIDKKAGLPDDYVYDIVEDDDNNIWASTYTGGITIVNIEAKKIKYLKKTSGLESDTLSAMAKDKTGRVWVSSFGIANPGLDAVDIKNGTITHYADDFKKIYTLRLFFDDNGILWCGINNGIILLDVNHGTTRSITQADGIKGNFVLAFVSDNYHRVWVASNLGLNMIDQSGATIRPYTDDIASILEDVTGSLWLASQKGLIIVNTKRKEARLLTVANGLSDEFVQSFAKFENKIIVNTNGGFNIIDPVSKTIKKINRANGLANDTIYSTFIDRSGTIWLTGPSNGINTYDTATHIIKHAGVKGGLSDENIADVKQDNDGLLWLATNKGGIDVLDLKKGTVKVLKNAPGLADTCNRILLADDYGRMWIGTDKGLYVADTKLGTLTTITTKEGLTHNHILSLLPYKTSIVAGTVNKINIIDAPIPNYHAGPQQTNATWKINVLDKSENLVKQNNSWASDYITSNGEYLWGDDGITTITQIKPAAGLVNTYVTGITLMTQPQYFANPYTVNKNDTLWANDTFYVNGQKPFNNVKSELTWDSVTAPYNLPVNLQVPYNKNFFQFQFAQASLSRQDTTWYSYFLQGIDRKWSAPTSNTFTENYMNLQPGNYTFKVSSKSIGGQWSVPASFSFTITPPWYSTWWAYTIFALLAIGILRVYIVYRSRRLQAENKLLEEKINLRTSQLQKSIEDLKATQSQLVQSEKMASLGELTAGIAHEIQNPLNFINNFSEINTELIDEMTQEIEKGNLDEVRAIALDLKENEQKINHHGKRADTIVKGMLQHSRSSNGAKEPTNINALADEYLRLSYHGLRAKDKSFNATFKTDFDETIGRINVVPEEIGRTILNLITNAFYAVNEKKKQLTKDSPPFEPTVTVSTRKTDGKVVIRVADNGNGISQKNIDKIFNPFFTTKPAGQGTGLGLSLSYDIVKAHGGELKVETKEGEGVVFIVELPMQNRY